MHFLLYYLYLGLLCYLEVKRKYHASPKYSMQYCFFNLHVIYFLKFPHNSALHPLKNIPNIWPKTNKKVAAKNNRGSVERHRNVEEGQKRSDVENKR